MRSANPNPQLPTYFASVQGLVVAASATDVLTLTGAAGREIRLTGVLVSGVATAAGTLGVQLLRRSTLDSAGTSTTPGIVRADPANDPVAAAVVTAYTANPTLGNLVGTAFAAARLCLPLAGAFGGEIEWRFGERGAKAPTLFSANGQLVLNLGGLAVPAGAVLDVSLEWTEA